MSYLEPYLPFEMNGGEYCDKPDIPGRLVRATVMSSRQTLGLSLGKSFSRLLKPRLSADRWSIDTDETNWRAIITLVKLEKI